MGLHATKTQYNAKVTLKGEVDEGIIKDAAERLYFIAYQRNLEPNDIKVEQSENLTRVSTLYSIEAEDEQYVLAEEKQEQELRVLKFRVESDLERLSEKYPGLEVKTSGKTVRIYEKIPFCEFCQKKNELRAMEEAPSFRRSPEKKKDSNFIKVVPDFTARTPEELGLLVATYQHLNTYPSK